MKKLFLKRKFIRFIDFITEKNVIVDITGTILTPGNGGKNCKGNGEQNIFGKTIECCCDECDYLQECCGAE